jgi:hypothetical protein
MHCVTYPVVQYYTEYVHYSKTSPVSFTQLSLPNPDNCSIFYFIVLSFTDVIYLESHSVEVLQSSFLHLITYNYDDYDLSIFLNGLRAHSLLSLASGPGLFGLLLQNTIN